MLLKRKRLLQVLLPVLVAGVLNLELPIHGLGTTVLAQDSRFENYEIRVIRPKFMQKRKRFELGAEFLLVMNDTFVYTLMVSGILTYHFSETFAFETAASIGQSVDRNEKEILFDDFEIKTEVFRTLYAFEGSLLYTPVYGKVQLPKGKLIYFDSFLALGGGITGVEWRYDDFCQVSNNPNESQEIPGNTVKSYPNIVYGIGQRIFTSRKASLRWDLRTHTVFYNRTDASCDVNAEGSANATHNNITLQIGASRFF